LGRHDGRCACITRVRARITRRVKGLLHAHEQLAVPVALALARPWLALALVHVVAELAASPILTPHLAGILAGKTNMFDPWGSKSEHLKQMFSLLNFGPETKAIRILFAW
jgi:hypothetical protein